MFTLEESALLSRLLRVLGGLVIAVVALGLWWFFRY